MYLIVGLGNPEPQYSRTRHNMGFDAINAIAKKFSIDVNKTKYDAIYGSGVIEGKKVILIKPQTFMNLSGKAVKKFANFYKVPIENIIVIYDDMDLGIGKIRVRAQGTAGAHNGMKSMIRELGAKDFLRFRIGIGQPENENEKIEYVINRIPEEEYMKLQKGVDKIIEALIYFFEKGIDNTMNKFNQKEKNEDLMQ